MREGPEIARVAALIADPARSSMLIALMDGRALTATELAELGGITKQTASSHLAKLVDGEVLMVEAQGRHRLRKARICYDHLAGEMGVQLFERMQVDQWLANDLSVTDRGSDKLAELGLNLRDLPPSNRPLCRACLDWSQRRQHLAGRLGKAILDHLVARSWARRLPDSRVISFTLEGERIFNRWLR